MNEPKRIDSIRLTEISSVIGADYEPFHEILEAARERWPRYRFEVVNTVHTAHGIMVAYEEFAPVRFADVCWLSFTDAMRMSEDERDDWARMTIEIHVRNTRLWAEAFYAAAVAPADEFWRESPPPRVSTLYYRAPFIVDDEEDDAAA